MSERSMHLLPSFQATASKSGSLFAEATYISDETQDSAVSFSNVLNQAQSKPADESVAVAGKEQDEAEPSASQKSVDSRKIIRLESSPKEDSQSLNNLKLGRRLGALEEFTEKAVELKSVLRSYPLSEDIARASNSVLGAQRNNGPIQMSSGVAEPSSIGQEQTDVALPTVTVDTSSDIALNLDANNTQPQIVSPTETLPANLLLQKVGVDEPLSGDLTSLQDNTVATTVVDEIDAPEQTQPANGNDDQPDGSAAVVANRLSVQPYAPTAPLIAQLGIAEAARNVGTEVERLTTIASIQSIKAGVSGLAKAPASSSLAAPARASASILTESINSALAPLSPVATNAKVSYISASSTIEPLEAGGTGAVGSDVNVIRAGASNIQPTAGKELPIAPNANGGSFNSARTESHTQLLMATAAKVATNDSLTPSPQSHSLDNMLSVPASGIVTAPILAKADLTGTSLPQTPWNVPLLTSAATEALAGNVRWMVGEGVQNAVVNVSPHGMGPISVQIGIEKEQMSISIVASQSNTREALDSLLPRLRDQLTAQGVETIRVDISDGRNDRSGNHSGFDRHNTAYTTVENSQQRSFDEKSHQSNSFEFNDSQTNESGERTLSDSEKILVNKLKNSSTNSSVKNVSISHGYDLYV